MQILDKNLRDFLHILTYIHYIKNLKNTDSV